MAARLSGNILDRYVPGPSGDEAVLWYQGPGTANASWLYADQQGSTIAWSDGSGNGQGTQAYDPFGQPQSWSGPRYSYTGQLMLSEAQLYDYKARAYDPALGRFLQTDPAGYASDLNPYAYVFNGPLSGIDPTGMVSSLDECFICEIQVVAGDPVSGVQTSTWTASNGQQYTDIFNTDSPFYDPYNPAGGAVTETIVGGVPGGLLPGLGGGSGAGYGIGGGGGGESGSPGNQTPQNKFTIVHGTPPGAIKCSAYGMTFLAPPGFNLGNIAAAGRAGGWNLGAMNAAVGQYGSFDFQRSRGSSGNTTYYPAYQVASNVAVGAYLNGTGIPEILSNAIEDTFALFKSSNAGNGDQIMGQEIGWDAAAGNASLSCGSGR